MSNYQFLSSNKPLTNVDHTQTELLTIEEAEARGDSMPNWYSKDMDIDRTKKIVMWAPSQECFSELYIWDHDHHGSSSCKVHARGYSDKQYFADLTWNYSDKRAEQLIAYMKEHLTESSEIEMWNVWLGNAGEEKDGVPRIKRCAVDSLTISDIKAFREADVSEESPYCLVVFV